MKKMALFFLSCMLLCLAAPAAQAQEGSAEHAAKLADIRELLIVTGASKLGIQIMEHMLPDLKALASEVPEQFWTNVMKEFNADELVDLVVPVYDKYLTHDEVKELVRFYKTPVGQKVVSVLPQMTQESMELGRAWGMKMAQRVFKEMQEKGYLKEKSGAKEKDDKKAKN